MFDPEDACMNWTNACKEDCDNHPQICIDWCDAYAYCAAVGKRLCGHIQGGPVEHGEADDPSVDPWHYVCSQGVGADYPYFGGFHSNDCNGVGLGVGTTLPVASLQTCQASHPNATFHGVYDLSGNVAEWEDSCYLSPSNAEVCPTRGGSFGHWMPDLSCAPTLAERPTDRSVATGFRCCSLQRGSGVRSVPRRHGGHTS